VISNRERQENIPHPIDEVQDQQMSRASFATWLGSWQKWGSVVSLFLALEIAVFSIEHVRWIDPQPSLTVVLVLAILTGWLLTKSQLTGAAAYSVAVVLGAIVTVWQVSSLLPTPETVARVGQLIALLQSWWQEPSIAEISESTPYFAVFLVFFVWIIGYISTWFILRRKNAWVAVTLGTTAILVNLSNLPGQYYIFFFFYVLAAALLIGRMSLANHHSWFKKHGTNYPIRGLIYFIASPLCLGIIAVSIAWITPEIRVDRLETLVATKMSWIKSIEESPANFFTPVREKLPSLKSSKQKELSFGEAWHRSNEIQFVVASERPSYWRVRMYDTYTSWGWTNSLTSERTLKPRVPWTEARMASDRDELTYTVVNELKTDVILTAGEFISSDTLVSLQIGAGDVITVTTPRPLKHGEGYTVTSRISSMTPADLSQAGEDYPDSITDHYLQLPPSFPERVSQLSEDITKEVKSPQGKMLAIQGYLAQFPYRLEVEPPPQGVDGVEHFLFTEQSGCCLYFASATAVMLRSVDVPSRLLVGYLPGELDSSTGNYILRDKHYHAWVEVYFPDYGWVEVEATPTASIAVSSNELGVPAYIMEELDEWELWEIMGIPGETTVGNVDTESSDAAFPTLLGVALLLSLAGILLLIFLLFALRSAFYRGLWHLKGPDYASEIYIKMCSLASLVKLSPKPQQTPLEYCAQLASLFPQQAKAIDHIVQAYLESRFGRRPRSGLPQEAELLKSRVDVYHALLKRRIQRRWFSRLHSRD
jgi:hypothetical protein